jgi:hypothetical protein
VEVVLLVPVEPPIVDVPVVPEVVVAVVSVVIVPVVSVDVAIVPDVSVEVAEPIAAVSVELALVSVDIAAVSVPAVSMLVFSSFLQPKANSARAATIRSAVIFFIRNSFPFGE